ncbi:DUF4148 domain-containing protein [Paraburkholderia sp. CNPSo 3272]|uniref:DUF4148 domain-containing protein n=1 Tax=Paraburkholderia sp. CNPSo 3272 TaxID=2940931 RepID=UPI0035CD2E28
MNRLHIVVAFAAALLCTSALAQDTAIAVQPAEEPTPNNVTTTSFGGYSAPTSETGSPTGKTREQVYRELLQSQHSGESARLQQLYKGN